MSYISGGLIEATDYNGFISTNSGANLNATAGTASITSGYGNANISTVSASSVVTATQWATLVNGISTMASHQGSSITSRTAPVVGNTITILSAVATDLGTIFTNRYNAAGSGTTVADNGAQSKTTATGSGGSSWTITFTNTLTFANSSAFFSFFNAGGLTRLQFGKSSTGTVADTAWNAFVGSGAAASAVMPTSLFMTGVAASKTINGVSYTGTFETGGTGTPGTYTTGTGVYNLTTSDTTILQQNNSATYSSNFIRVQARVNNTSTPTVITFTTLWSAASTSTPGSTAQITGGTATTTSGATTTFGTAPSVVLAFIPPSTTFLTNNWGTPTLSGSVS